MRINTTKIGWHSITRDEYYALKKAGAVRYGATLSDTPGYYGQVCFYYFFDAEGNEVGHFSPDMYEFTGVVLQSRRWGEPARASIKQWCEFPDQNTPEARYARYAAAQYAYGWSGTLSEEVWLERNRDTDSYSY